MAVKCGQVGGNADTYVASLGFAVAILAKLEMKIQFVNNGPYPT